MDLLDHLVSEDVVAVEHLDDADGAGAGVAGVLHLGEAALPDGLADLVRPHPRLPPRRRCRRPRGLRVPSWGGLRHPSADDAVDRAKKRTDRQGARDEAPRARWVRVGLLVWFDGRHRGRERWILLWRPPPLRARAAL